LGLGTREYKPFRYFSVIASLRCNHRVKDLGHQNSALH
jgi:hypothetical protein